MLKVDKNGNNDGKNSRADYHKQMMDLKAKIKPQAENLDDLKNAQKIKKQMIKLAEQNGDTETASILKDELARIEKDIARNTSIF